MFQTEANVYILFAVNLNFTKIKFDLETVMIGIMIVWKKYDGKSSWNAICHSMHIFRFEVFPMTHLWKSNMNKKVNRRKQRQWDHRSFRFLV